MYEHVHDKNVLVTGGTGFIGLHLVKRLLQEGARVHVFVRDTRKAEYLMPEGVRIVTGNITDRGSLRQAVKDKQVIYHLAAALAHRQRPLSLFRKVNIEGTRCLAEEALEHDVERFIHVSSVWVYGLDTKGLVDERSPRLKSNSPYSDTKIEAENIVHEMVEKRGFRCVIVQPNPPVYGPGECAWTTVPLQLMKYRLMFVPDHGRGCVTPIYIDDLIEGMIRSGEHGKIGEAYILTGNDTVTTREYFQYLVDMIGRKNIPLLSKKTSLALAGISEMITRLTSIPIITKEAVRSVMMKTTYSSDKARRELSFEPEIDLKEGMKRVRDYVKRGKQAL